MMHNIKRILVFRPDGIGDAINSTPAISALRDAYRNAHLAVVLRPPGAEILSLNPDIDEIIICDAGNLTTKLRFLRLLRAGCYDMAVVLRDASWCNFMAYASGARYRVGRRAERRMFSFTLTHAVTSRDPKGTKHEVDRNLDIVRLTGAKGGDNRLILNLSEDEKAWARDFLHRQGVDETAPLVGVHPGGSSSDKLWSPENFAHVANQLMKRFDAKIMLFNGPGEDHLARSIQGAMTHPPILAAGLGVRQSAALIGRCSLFLCNDSGPMHIAAALKVPTVALFGPTDYVRWRPRSEKAVIVRLDMDCFPCNIRRCKKGLECIKSLPVEDVLDAGCWMLDARC